MEKDIGYLLKAISEKMRSRVDTRMKSYDLTLSQGRVLHFIEYKGGSVTQKEIEESLEVSHPTVVGLLSRLQKNGFIECLYDVQHGKNKIVRMSEKAREFSEETARDREKSERELVEGLNENEVKELKRLLGILYKNSKKPY